MAPTTNELSLQSSPVAPAGVAKPNPSLRERFNRFWARLRQYG